MICLRCVHSADVCFLLLSRHYLAPGLGIGVSRRAGSSQPNAHQVQCSKNVMLCMLQMRLLRQGLESGWQSEGIGHPAVQPAGQALAYDRLLQEAIDLFVGSGAPSGAALAMLKDMLRHTCSGHVGFVHMSGRI